VRFCCCALVNDLARTRALNPRLLRVRRQRPRSRAAEKGDKLAPSHSITSSGRASSVGGKVRPSAFAVLRLNANSNLVGCATGRSAGLHPSCGRHRCRPDGTNGLGSFRAHQAASCDVFRPDIAGRNGIPGRQGYAPVALAVEERRPHQGPKSN
jgi:hypothetical protein